MEGYLIRLPACAWDNEGEGNAVKRRGRRTCKPQARLLYYVLGEGFIEGYASPDSGDPIESFQLTSFEVNVDPIFSMLMFKVTTREKKPAGLAAPAVLQTDETGNSSDEEDNDMERCKTASMGTTILFFAGDKSQVDLWSGKILNWKRYVFSGPPSSVENSDPIKAKTDLIRAFHDKNNHGMFSILCELKDCTLLPPGESAPFVSDLTSTSTPPPLLQNLQVSHQLSNKKQIDTTKTGNSDIKPLWMLLHRTSSRRIRAIPPRK